jgi:hypothetical protein
MTTHGHIGCPICTALSQAPFNQGHSRYGQPLTREDARCSEHLWIRIVEFDGAVGAELNRVPPSSDAIGFGSQGTSALRAFHWRPRDDGHQRGNSHENDDEYNCRRGLCGMGDIPGQSWQSKTNDDGRGKPLCRPRGASNLIADAGIHAARWYQYPTRGRPSIGAREWPQDRP